MLSTLQGIALLLVVLVFSRLVRYRQIELQHLPGFCPPLGPPGALVKTSWWNMSWVLRKTFCKSGENVSVVPFLIGTPAIYTSNLDVASEI
ncbi:hypothetical protein CPB85DRAFT_1440672 [Mucidula mucida]|nr:hypothetical protein CPB85DRAFT_1440672 [Mucidula mucida]